MGSSPATAGLTVLTGPSGVGKGTLVARLLERHPRVWLSVSATTRAPRAGEREGGEVWVSLYGISDVERFHPKGNECLRVHEARMTAAAPAVARNRASIFGDEHVLTGEGPVIHNCHEPPGGT